MTAADLRFRARTVDLGVPEDATCGDGTSLVGVPARRCFFFTYLLPPAKTRLARFELEGARLEATKGVRGELRGGAFDSRGNTLHALTSMGLYEVGLDPLAIRREQRSGIPKHAHALIAAEDLELLAVCRTRDDPAPLVSAGTYEVVAKASAFVDAAFAWHAKPHIFSFCRGTDRAP